MLCGFRSLLLRQPGCHGSRGQLAGVIVNDLVLAGHSGMMSGGSWPAKGDRVGAPWNISGQCVYRIQFFYKLLTAL
jgi:hypothetical protein